MRQIILASNNQGKVSEFQAIFQNIGIDIIPQYQLNVPEVDEPYFTFIENALHKARHCSKFTNLPVLADDSGICAAALGGNPGIYSARFAGVPVNSKNNSMKLVKELKPFTDKSAYYYCILVLIRHHDDPQPIIAEGSLEGQIIDIPRGENGFGYDPYMLIPHLNKTVAELPPSEKNTFSHRYLAIQDLLKKICNFIAL